jgi:hypothetical protein
VSRAPIDCRDTYRQANVLELLNAVPNLKTNWLYFENNLAKANRNCRERRNRIDAAEHVKINGRFSPNYSYPDGALFLEIWTNQRGARGEGLESQA